MQFFAANFEKSSGSLSFWPKKCLSIFVAWVFFALSFFETVKKKPVLLLHDTSIRKWYFSIFYLFQTEVVQVLRSTYFRLPNALNLQETVNDGLQSPVWVEMNPQHYFADYALEGVTPEANQILMEINTEALAKSLGQLKSSGQGAPKSLKVAANIRMELQYFLELS